jgi:hypothetical protein
MASPPIDQNPPNSLPDPKETTEEPSKSPFDPEEFKGRLSDEYKILQDKIDKIGAFRFTIKGWSITAVIAAAAASSGKGLYTVCIISLGLVLMLIFFFSLEYEQVKWSRLFGSRAGRIEDAFRRISRGKGIEISDALPVPFIAHELVLAGRPATPRREARNLDKLRAVFRTWFDNWRLCRQAHIFFYLILIALALALLLPHHDEIAAYYRLLKEKLAHSSR